MIRKIAAVLVILLLCSIALPTMAAGGNGGSSGSDGAGSGASGGSGGDGASAGNARAAPGPERPRTQELQEEQERIQQETIDQPGIQITQQDRDQDQGRTGVVTNGVSDTADLARQGDRDTFLHQIDSQPHKISHDRDRARVDLALYALSLSENVTGSTRPELARIGADLNSSYDAALRAEQRIAVRSSVFLRLFGGDREAAGLLIQYADQNQQRIQEMEQLLMNCSDCDPQVRLVLEKQLQVLSQEQNRLKVLGSRNRANGGCSAGCSADQNPA